MKYLNKQNSRDSNPSRKLPLPLLLSLTGRSLVTGHDPELSALNPRGERW